MQIYLNSLQAYLPAMKRAYWMNKNRVIFPLPAPLKEQLEDKGVAFQDNGIVDYRIIGKKVVIEFEMKDE